MKESIAEGLLEDKKDRDTAKDFLSMTFAEFLWKYGHDVGDKWIIEDSVVKSVDAGRESLVVAN